MLRLLRHSEGRVVMLVFAVLLAGEAGMRLYGERLSKDIEHLEEFEAIAARCAALPADDRLRLLFLGNSLTRYGVQTHEFARAAQAAGGPPIRAEKMTPDNTALADWFYAYRTYFHAAGRAPDVLVIGFGDGHLRDAPSHHPARLAQYYCRLQDLPELCARDLPTFEARAGYGAACGSALLCNRDRIERRVLDALIPGYRDGLQSLNERARRALPPASTAASYSRLRELLELTKRDGVRVVLAAMPVPAFWEIDPALADLARECGATLVDCRTVPGITIEMFPDGLHMNSAAAVRYSRFLAAALQAERPLAQAP